MHRPLCKQSRELSIENNALKEEVTSSKDNVNLIQQNVSNLRKEKTLLLKRTLRMILSPKCFIEHLKGMTN